MSKVHCRCVGQARRLSLLPFHWQSALVRPSSALQLASSSGGTSLPEWTELASLQLGPTTSVGERWLRLASPSLIAMTIIMSLFVIDHWYDEASSLVEAVSGPQSSGGLQLPASADARAGSCR